MFKRALVVIAAVFVMGFVLDFYDTEMVAPNQTTQNQQANQ